MTLDKIRDLLLRPRVPYILLALGVFIAYINVYDNAFLFDDDLTITLNTLLLNWDTLDQLLISSTTNGAHIAGGFYRPMQDLAYFIIYQFGGLTKIGYHLLNVGLHAANACLAFALGRRLGFNPLAVFFSVLLWAVHPLHTEAITYMSGTADPLFVFFCLLGLVRLAPDFAPNKIYKVLPIFALALLSKETAMVFPPLVMVSMFLASGNRLSPKTYLRTWPLWALAIIYMSWRVTTPYFDGPQSYGKLYDLHDFSNLKLYAENPMWRVNTFLASLPSYAQLLAWPTGLHMERAFMIFTSVIALPVFLGFCIMLAAAGQLVWGHGKRGLPLSWGILWFFAAHFPDTGLLVPVNSLFLEHWMYLPTLGLFIGIGQTIYEALARPDWQKYRPVAAALALAAVTGFILRTWDQNAIWHDPIKFYANVFDNGEVSARSHNNLALAYGNAGDYPHAVEEFRKAIAITDTYAETRYNLALALLNLPDQRAHIDEAISDLNRSLEIDPNFYRSYNALAQVYAFVGDSEKAALNRQKADELLQKFAH